MTTPSDPRYDGIFKTCMNCKVTMPWLTYCECMRNLLHKKKAKSGRITAAEGMVSAASVTGKKEKDARPPGSVGDAQGGLF